MRHPLRLVLLTLPLALAACSDDDAPGRDAAVDAAPDATPDAGAVALDPGELHDVPGDASGVAEVTLATPDGDEVFLVMVQSRARTLARQERWGITATGSTQRQRTVAPPPPPPPPRARRCGAVSTSTPWRTFARDWPGSPALGGRCNHRHPPRRRPPSARPCPSRSLPPAAW